MTTRFLSVLLILFSAIAAQAYTVKAVVTDSVGEALPYVTYRVYADADSTHKALISNTTDVNGIINQSVENAGTYRMTLSYVGMADLDMDFTLNDASKIVDLGTLQMSEGSQMLNDVTVTAQKPLVTKLIDRLAYDVQADPQTPSSKLNDILRKVPMVSVDPDGTIKVNGSTDFKIYKNGRPNNSMSRNAKELFQAMPASMIKRVEVITEPGAEYDAEGTAAILNIITADNTSIKGVLGSANVGYSSTNSKIPYATLWLTSEINKVSISFNGGYQAFGGTSSCRSRDISDRTYKDGTSQHEESEAESKGVVGWIGFEGSWQPDTLNLFTAEMNGFFYRVHSWGASLLNSADAASNAIGSMSINFDNPFNRYFDIDANFNYQHKTHRKGETYTLSYLLSHTDQSSEDRKYYDDVEGIFQIPYSTMQSYYKLNFIEHTFQADYTRELGAHSIAAGLKGIIRRNHSNNDIRYVDYRDVLSEFAHVTSVGAVYTQYSAKVGKFGFRAGLRYEYSHLKASYPDGSGKDYSSNFNDWVPSVAINWQINDANSLNFNYGTSIRRPGISYLNPAVIETPNMVGYGNPDLGSSMRHSLRLTYMIIKPKFNLNFSTNYDFANGDVSPVAFTEGQVMHRTFANIGHQRRIAFRTNVQWSITPKTRFNINGSVGWGKITQQDMKMSRWSNNIYAQLTQTLPLNIESSLFFYYDNRGVSDVYHYYDTPFSSSSWWGISLSKSLLKGNRLNLRLDLMNLIGRHKDIVTYDYYVNGDVTGKTTSYRNSPIGVSFNISYRFGSLQSSVKKVDKSITNDDLDGKH